MQSDLETLLIIQDRDQKIIGLKADLERVPLEEEAAKSRLSSDEKAVIEAKTAVQENEVAMKNLELSIDTRKGTINRLKIQQYETKKNEEYRAMGNEIERYQKEITALEDQELELMEKGEVLRKTQADAVAARTVTQRHVDEDLEQFARRRENFSKRLEDLMAERAELATQADPNVLDIYERILSKKRDAAVVALADGQCGGCHMKVIKSTIVAVKAGKGVTHCENCGRILYLSE